jgi:hypothetical protein
MSDVRFGMRFSAVRDFVEEVAREAIRFGWDLPTVCTPPEWMGDFEP